MPAKINTEIFIKRAKAVHGDRYDYSLVDYKSTHSLITIICPKHGEFEQSPSNHLKYSGCKKCSIGSVFDTKSFIEKAKEVHGERYDYGLVDYKRSKEKLTIICPEHGEFKQNSNAHTDGRGCPKCGGSQRSNTQSFVEKSKQVHGDKYDYGLVDYKNCESKVTIICPEHGEFLQTPSNHLEGKSCPDCGALRSIVSRTDTTLNYISRAKEVHSDKYDYSLVDYKKRNEMVVIICPEHGEFEQSSNSHLRGRGCPYCGNLKRGLVQRSNSKNFITKAQKVHDDRYDYSLVEYKTCKDYVSIICPIHGKFEQIPNNHLQGQGCSKCFFLGGPSKSEDALVDFIKTFYTQPIITSDRTYIKPKELDIVLPDINLAIEFNGLYWHSDAMNTPKNYHLNKTKACRSAGLRLIHVFESEWVNTPDIVKSRLKQLIGVQTNRIHARQCSVRELSPTEAKEFFNRTHIQGHIGNRIALGLIHNDKIVSAMSFGKPRYNKDYDFELLRFSNELNVSVVGGASKLFKNFQRLYNSPSVISYADLRWSDGNLYEVLGFDFVRQSSPNYYYFKGTSLELESRIKYQKHKLPKILDEFDESLSETENMALNGYNRIFDCGNAVYAYNP